ncbi:MAG: NAD(+) synthase [Longimicrobiales bacterium]
MTDGRGPKISMVQMKPDKGDVGRNLASLTKRVDPDVDIALFPEAVLSGYFVEGAVSEVALTCRELETQLGEPPHGAAGPDVAIGFYERHNHDLFNSIAYLTPTKDRYETVHVHRKVFLPTYGVFEEARFVKPGRDFRAFDTRFGRIGLLVCEDMWHSVAASILALDGANVLLCGSASPARGFLASETGRPENLAEWDRIGARTAKEHGVFVFISQLVGSEGGKLFPGGSTAWGPDGGLIDRGPLFEEAATTVTARSVDISRARAASPLLSDLRTAFPHLRASLDRAVTQDRSKEARPALRLEETSEKERQGDPLPEAPLGIDPDLVEAALVEFIREEVTRRRGFQRVVVGVSGGVDSAVSLYLACRALGPENVYGFRLPYATSSQDSLDHAALALEATGAQMRTIPITSAVDGYVAAEEPDLSPLRRGNLAARLRSVVLFDQSAKLRGLPLGTGNKSERLLGYYTWHADDSPPINPLGDLFKTQVWQLARHLGVPDVIIDKPASADLVKGVHDEDELGISYTQADPILYWLLQGLTPDALVRGGFEPSKVDVVWRRLSSTHWKRELPTVAMLTDHAIGEFYLRPVDY